MRCLKPMTMMTVVAAALFAVVLLMSVTRPVTVEAATPAAEPQAAAKSAPTAQAPAAARPAPQTAPGTPAPGYIGAEACATCHENYDKNIEATKHGFAANLRTPMAKQGCETCHGPGEAHASDPEKIKPKQFNKLPAAEVNATCTTCHDRTKHALWSGSQHDQRNLACTTCHSVHSSKSAKAMLKAANEPALCVNCHSPIVKKLNRNNHMPVREGKMQCSSCHNTHGSTNVKLLKNGTTVDEACTTCHAEKRGPYLWEHAPVSNSCVTCHDPHGSSNDRMLVAKAPFLCQRCHVTSRHPPTVYDGFVLNNSQNANKIYGKGCVNCHQQIHGSNHPNGQMFLR
jgi:DmsE family decaheme c-type cytochrome